MRSSCPPTPRCARAHMTATRVRLFTVRGGMCTSRTLVLPRRCDAVYLLRRRLTQELRWLSEGYRGATACSSDAHEQNCARDQKVVHAHVMSAHSTLPPTCCPGISQRELTCHCTTVQVLSDLDRAGAVVYGVGSLYTSIAPSLVLQGVGEGIAARTHMPKVLMLNGSHDRETSARVSGEGPMTAVRPPLLLHARVGMFISSQMPRALASARAASDSGRRDCKFASASDLFAPLSRSLAPLPCCAWLWSVLWCKAGRRKTSVDRRRCVRCSGGHGARNHDGAESGRLRAHSDAATCARCVCERHCGA